MFASNKNGIRAAVLLLFLAWPGELFALPVAVEQVEKSYSLEQTAFYLVDERGDIGILEASSPLRQNHYSRLEDGIPVTSGGSLWMRFSLISNNQTPLRPLPDGAQRSLFLDLGPGMSGARLYVADNVSADGQIKTWRESAPLDSGHFLLPEPDALPHTIYVRLPGSVSLWFDPLLIRGDMDDGPIPWLLILQIAMGLTLAVMLARGISRNEEWRFWAGAVLVCAIIPTLFGQYGSEPNIIYLTAMPRLLSPGLAIMFIPHLGRYLLGSQNSKPLDYTLIVLSLLGVATALVPLVPGFGWTARLLPLAPLLLLPLIIISMARVRSGQSGASLYLIFNLFPFTGAALAFATLLSPVLQPLEAVGPNLTAIGYLAGGLLLALGQPAAAKEKGDFFPLNEFLEAPPLNTSQAAAPDKKNSGAGTPQDELADSHLLYWRQSAGPGEYPAAETSSGNNMPTENKNVTGMLEPKPLDLGPDMEVFAAKNNLEERVEGDGAEDAEGYAKAESYRAEPSAATRQDKNIIYVKDAEEPGLVILKTAGHARIDGLAPVHPSPTPAHDWEYTAISRLEGALRAPYEQLVHQLDDIRSRQELAADYADGLEKSLSGLGLMLDNLERLARGEPFSTGASQTIFNLAQLIRRIHEELLPLAEKRGIALSWFVAPGLPAYFKGLEQEIAQAIKFLLQGTLDGALDGPAGGAVQLSVRQGSDAYAGQIQFSLQESGMRSGHLKRPSGWLNKAWELAASSGGSFNIDFIQNKGMAITLALPLTPVQAAPAQEPAAAADHYHKLSGSAALAESAPGPDPEGVAKPVSSPPGIEENDDEVLLLTDAVFQTEQSPDAPSTTVGNDAVAAQRPVPAHNASPGPEVASETRSEPDISVHSARPPQYEERVAQEYKKIVPPESSPIIISDDELLDIPASLRPESGAPHPAAKPAHGLKPEKRPREYIVIADMAASGRRLLARRLDGLPYKLIEARNADEIVQAVSRHPVGLIIVDADMPEADLKKAFERVADYNLAGALPVTPSLCILSHESQAERMTRLGCGETQLKAASREQFRQTVLRLCPHPNADPAGSAPEIPLPRAAVRQNVPHQASKPMPVLSAPAPEQSAKSETAGKDRIPMLDMIVASLDTESEKDQSASESANSFAGGDIDAEASPLKFPYPISSSNGDYMEAEMVPLIPGLLNVLEDSLGELSAAVLNRSNERVKDVASRIVGQGGTFGLQTLKRMARCVEHAADAGDAEAIRDFSDELIVLGRRYLARLKETHADYLKKN